MESKSESNEFHYETYQHENSLQNHESVEVGEVGELTTETKIKRSFYSKLSLVFFVVSLILVSALLFTRSSKPNPSFKKQVTFTSKDWHYPTSSLNKNPPGAHIQPTGH